MDQSLDAIIASSRPKGAPRTQRRSRPGRATRAAPAGPAGGVAKKSSARKPTAKVPTGPSSSTRAAGSKVMISGFPTDVAAKDIEAYINRTAGSVKRIELAYGPNGKSRGSATVTFKDQEGAQKAMDTIAGTKIDGRPLKIEALVDANTLQGEAAKSLADRIVAPKTSAAGKAGARKGAAKGDEKKKAEGKKGRSGRAGRPKPKTIEELDQEMLDYQAGGAENGNGVTNGATTSTNGGGEMDIAS